VRSAARGRDGWSKGIAANREQGRDVGFSDGAAGRHARQPALPAPAGVPVTSEQATAGRVAAVRAERDAIQANLLELDGSFGKRVLEGATLTGQTRERWERASAALAGLWETFLAYSAVVDQIAALAAGRRSPKKDQAELEELLTGGCVQLAGPPVPLARRDLAAQGRPPVTLAAAVGAMRRAFTEVTEVTTAAEAVWTAAGEPLDAATADLAAARPVADGLGPDLETEFAAAEAAVVALRAEVNADPLARWAGGQAEVSAASRLREQVTALTARIAELDRVRQRARQRIDGLAAAAASARMSRQEAEAAWREASDRVSGLAPLPPGHFEPPPAGLAAVAAAGQWSRLAAELDRYATELDQFAAQTTAVGEAAAAAVGQRDELRGLLRAYKAKAARLGAAEDADLSARYDQAHDLLWTAPCDLPAAHAAVSTYQRAILATEGHR
jgi:hypothetical protein